jgi:hypothetical protein
VLVRVDSGFPAWRVGVEGYADAALAQVNYSGERSDLLAGECCAAGSDSGEGTVTGDADRYRVERPFD